MQTNNKTFKIVLSAMMMCLIMVAILFIRIPIPFTQGYAHLGDAMIFLAVLVLGWRVGAVTAGVGAMMGDVIGGFAAWAPWTFAIKAIMAIILGIALEMVYKKENVTKGKLLAVEIIAMIVSGAFMCAAYYAAEGIMYGNWIAPLAGIPWNIGQFAIGMVIALILAEALCKTPAKKYFTYKR